MLVALEVECAAGTIVAVANFRSPASEGAIGPAAQAAKIADPSNTSVKGRVSFFISGVLFNWIEISNVRFHAKADIAWGVWLFDAFVLKKLTSRNTKNTPVNSLAK
ncbi:MAG: hypothetical protein MUO62_00255 [Anaerolineales bacterium]|nr:hypothetical protein [Anaerolineales bacterium]